MHNKFLFRYIFLSFFIFYSGTSWAQSASVRQIAVSGTLKDSASKEQLPFASLMLKNLNTNKEFIENTDSVGNFYFEEVPLGNYILKAYYVGYPQITRSVRIIASGNTQNLGDIYLKRGGQALKEVKVVDYKDLIEQRPDGITYLADQDPTNKGATAADVLRKVPMLTVDMDDNLALRGNGNVRVLIDGKPSTIIASSVSDVLKQIPSDNIKSIEVITSPGAKYDAEGSAGVVNIVTKQSAIKGISGRVFTGISYNMVDKQTRGYGGVELNYRHNKFGLSANLGGGHWSHTSEGESVRTNHPNDSNESILQQHNSNDGGGSFLWGRLSADYSIDSLNVISAGLQIHPGNWKTNNVQSTLFPARGLDYQQHMDQSSPRQGYSFNASYNKKFKDNPKHTLDLLALYSINNSNQSYQIHQNDMPLDVLSYQEKSNNLTKGNELTFQGDYAQPLKKYHQKIEAGVKYINRDISSDYDLYTMTPPFGSDWILAPNRTNLLEYSQQVAAAYGQFTTDLTQKLSLITGLRYEFTDIFGTLRDNGGSFHSQFNNWLPSAIFSYKLRKFDRINLSYSQRIERPSIRYINPYVNSSDQLNISKGNPELGPEQTHKIELTYNTIIGRSSINVATFYSHTRNGIEAWTDINSQGAAVTSYGNYGKGNTIGLNLFGSTTFFQRWRVNLNGNLYHKSLYGQDIQNDGWEYDAHFSSDVEIYKGLSVSAFGMYKGRSVMLQGTSSGWYRYSLGLKQKILKGNGDISISAQNFLSPNIKTTSDYNYGDAIYHTVSYRRARGIRIGFSYNFGNMKFKKPDAKIDNSDLKKEQDNNMDGVPSGGM